MRFASAAATMLALGAMPSFATAQAAPSFDWSGAIARGDAVEIIGVNGTIEARASEDGRVHVHAERSGRRSDPEGVRIEVVEHEDGVTICAVYPNPRGARHDNECEQGGGHMSVNDNDVEVDFTVRVPAGVRFVGANVNGRVVADGLSSDVEASTVNGDVLIRTAGLAEATTVNGDISASLGAVALAEGIEFSTVNGNIELELPAGLNADLDASTVNGGVDTDFEVRVRGSMQSESLRGIIGAGGPDLELSTVNGRIRLRRI